jgi:hypothetical protein
MADNIETATRVQDDGSGDYIATRSANEQDEGANDRKIQLVDFASRNCELYLLRNEAGPLADPAELEYGEPQGDQIEMGDKSTLIVYPAFETDSGSVSVTPIGEYDCDDYPVVGGGPNIPFPFPTKSSAMGSVGFYMVLYMYGPLYLGPPMVWDGLGAERIWLHVSALTGPSVSLLAGVI